MQTVHVTITGKTPLLLHSDSIEWADQMAAWQKNPEHKSKSVAGDDRTPPWRWIGCLYYNDPQHGVITMPSENIMRMLMDGASLVPTGKRGATFKSQSQSCLLCEAWHWPLLVNGETVSMEDVNAAKTLKTFSEQKDLAHLLGFDLFVKRVRMNTSKHIRVRPRFDNWSIHGDIVILDDQISVDTLRLILRMAGQFKGLGDWRTGSKTPGQFGLFTAEVNL